VPLDDAYRTAIGLRSDERISRACRLSPPVHVDPAQPELYPASTTYLLAPFFWLQIKNSAESENLNWILANTKPCPKCT